MPHADLIYIADSNPQFEQRVRQAARPLGCCLHFGRADLDALEEAARMDANVLAAGSQVLGAEGRARRRAMPGLPLRHCGFLLLLDNAPTDNEDSGAMDNGADDVLLRGASGFEIRARLQAALRLASLRQQWEMTRYALEQACSQDDRGDASLHEATTHLVEIAAHLQSEVAHSAEREAVSVRAAQSDTLAQAAAALRHEINNPLFAVMGSAESVLRRLNALQTCSTPNADIAAVIAGVERIQRGGERIQQVVQAISAMLTPAVMDYVTGVPMLKLAPEE